MQYTLAKVTKVYYLKIFQFLLYYKYETFISYQTCKIRLE